MNQIAVVYWSGTGHTQAMAECIAAACGGALFTADAFSANALENYDAIAFGCPAMGAEVLEEEVFQPLFDACRPHLSGKKLALFGSYGWGDGEWMRTWEQDCLSAGAVLACDSVICQDDPDADALAACQALAKSLQ